MKADSLFSVKDYGVIVTGGGSGIGLGYAEALAVNGAKATILDVDPERSELETRRMQAVGLEVRGHVVDVCDHLALDRAFGAAVAEHGRLDVVFANAGIDPGPGFMSASPAAGLVRNPAGALEPGHGCEPQWHLRHTARRRPNYASPTLRADMSKVIPLHRVGLPADMAGLALFLASPASAYITGQQISIDGGWTLGAAD